MDLVFDLSVAGHTLLSLKIFHKVAKILGSSLQDLFGSIENCYLRLNFGKHFFHLLVLSVFASEVGSILPEIISFHVLSSFGSSVLALFVGHGLLESLLFHFELLDFILLLLLLFGQHGGLGLEDSKFIVLWSVDLELVVEDHAVLLESLHIVGEPFELILSGHGLLK